MSKMTTNEKELEEKVKASLTQVRSEDDWNKPVSVAQE